MIVEIDLPPEVACRLERLVQSASTGDVAGVFVHPELRKRTRNWLVSEALLRWLPDVSTFDPTRGIRFDANRIR